MSNRAMLANGFERQTNMPADGALLTDFYQLNMIQAYLEHGKTETAVFEFFIRNLPPQRQFLVAAGLEQALVFIENFRFVPEELDWLEDTGRFGANLIEYLAALRFEGDVHAMPEGTVCFANEPLLRITAPLPVAQLVETRLMNLLHFQTLIASKAARFVLRAPDRLLVDFGLRRAHGAEAGLLAARAAYIAGFAGTATMQAAREFAMPLYGTMAHSFIQAFDREAEAFAAFAQSRPDHLVLLADTYDTEAAAHVVVAMAPKLAAAGIRIEGVRLDSGDLIALSKSVRQILDAGGLRDTTIFASGAIDEPELAAMIAQRAPIDGFGIGTSLTTSHDCPALDCAYKLQEYAGVARRKRSAGKSTWPGRKQVWRAYGPDGRMSGDTLSLEQDVHDGEPLILQVMKSGKRMDPPVPLAAVRARAAQNLLHLPENLRQLERASAYPVHIAESLRQLAAEVDHRTSG
jgi:nicotinate phosphoribosyltransferase